MPQKYPRANSRLALAGMGPDCDRSQFYWPAANRGSDPANLWESSMKEFTRIEVIQAIEAAMKQLGITPDEYM